jgi:hypothetical protein
MEANLIGERSNLLDDPLEKSDLHEFFWAHDFGAKAALKVADIADFDVHF